MHTLRKSLRRLGWPIDQMTDGQIKCELYRRWFACQPEEMDEEAPVSIASAKGIFVSMADEGNLDSLCWAENDQIPATEPAIEMQEDEQQLFIRESEHHWEQDERRRAPREPAREFVDWTCPDGRFQPATGWLVDRSQTGMAFIAAADQAPAPGTEIIPTVHDRTHDVEEFGPATVVRLEPLNPELILVCIQFNEFAQDQ